jgi:hypothetical protein|nr:MAG TPA: hypothetical protein [Caudoviricetes sp.]
MDKVEAFVEFVHGQAPYTLIRGKKWKCPKLARSMNGSVKGALNAAPLGLPNQSWTIAKKKNKRT